MKRTVEIPADLVVNKHHQDKAFKLCDASFKGEGIDPALEQASWERLRDMAYKGRDK